MLAIAIAAVSMVMSFVNLIIIIKVDKKIAENGGKSLFHNEVKNG